MPLGPSTPSVGPGGRCSDRRADPEYERCRYERVVIGRHTHHSRRRTEHAECRITDTRHRQQPYRDLDGPSGRQHTQRGHRVQYEIQPLRRGYLDDGVSGHQPIQPVRARGRRSYRRADPKFERRWCERVVNYQYAHHRHRRTERPGDRERRTAAGWQQHQADRHLDRSDRRRHAQRCHRVQRAFQSPRRRHLDRGVGGHQPVRAHRPERCNRDRCRGSRHERRGKSGCVVNHHNGHDLGHHGCTGKLDRCGVAGSQYKCCSERRRANGCDCRTDSGDWGGVRVVGK